MVHYVFTIFLAHVLNAVQPVKKKIMLVKIGDLIYDSNEEPIMLILDENDKRNISNMLPEATKYISFPDDEEYSEYRIRKFMNDV